MYSSFLLQSEYSRDVPTWAVIMIYNLVKCPLFPMVSRYKVTSTIQTSHHKAYKMWKLLWICIPELPPVHLDRNGRTRDQILSIAQALTDSSPAPEPATILCSAALQRPTLLYIFELLNTNPIWTHRPSTANKHTLGLNPKDQSVKHMSHTYENLIHLLEA